MAMSKKEVLKWIHSLPDVCDIAIDDGGLCLVQVGTYEKVYTEVGGEPREVCPICGEDNTAFIEDEKTFETWECFLCGKTFDVDK